MHQGLGVQMRGTWLRLSQEGFPEEVTAKPRPAGRQRVTWAVDLDGNAEE